MSSTIDGSQPVFGAADPLVHLRGAGVSLVLDCRGSRLPRVLHWGRDLGVMATEDLTSLAAASLPAVVPNSLDEPAAVSLIPEHAAGWMGLPGIRGHRDGADWSSLFAVTSANLTESVAGDAVRIEDVDEQPATNVAGDP